MERISTMRLYGSAIALVSGAYSVWLSTMGMMGMTTTDWLMLLVGVVVLAHGVALLTPLAGKLGRASGPLMVGYSALMLALQALMPAEMGMRPGMLSGSMMGGDAGMVAIAVLMLTSGVIMTTRREMLPSSDTADAGESAG
ncbi:hypothetical protein [Natronomonas sp. EA1]|uniref:hypothetical protein n=1 Tax=Natronomonas sp. EA1 TaxID=3421655 RepID=UPI003EC08449